MNFRKDPTSEIIQKEISGFAEPENSDKLIRILEVIREDQRGVTISQLSETLDINRNTIRKYTMVLAAAGYIEARSCGHTKIYNISDRIPANAVIENMFEGLLVLNRRDEINYYNEAMENIIEKIIPGRMFTTEEKLSKFISEKEIAEEIKTSKKDSYNNLNAENTTIKEIGGDEYMIKIVQSLNLEGDSITMILIINSENNRIMT